MKQNHSDKEFQTTKIKRVISKLNFKEFTLNTTNAVQ